MTKLAFLISFAIGAWWVLRRRQASESGPDRYAALVYVDEDGYVPGSTLLTGTPMYVDPPDPYPSSLLRTNGWDG